MVPPMPGTGGTWIIELAATSLILSNLHLDGFLPYKDCQEQHTRFTVAC